MTSTYVPDADTARDLIAQYLAVEDTRRAAYRAAEQEAWRRAQSSGAGPMNAMWAAVAVQISEAWHAEEDT